MTGSTLKRKLIEVPFQTAKVKGSVALAGISAVKRKGYRSNPLPNTEGTVYDCQLGWYREKQAFRPYQDERPFLVNCTDLLKVGLYRLRW